MRAIDARYYYLTALEFEGGTGILAVSSSAHWRDASATQLTLATAMRSDVTSLTTAGKNIENTKNTQKILFVAHSGNRGGAELCLDKTLGHLDRSKHQASVLFGSEGPMVDSARGLGFEVDVLPLAWWMCYDTSLWHFKRLAGRELIELGYAGDNSW